MIPLDELLEAVSEFIELYWCEFSNRVYGFLRSLVPLIEIYSYKLLLLILSGLWALFGNFLHLVHLLLCIVGLVVLVSFCRSLQSRYYLFVDENYDDDEAEDDACKPASSPHWTFGEKILFRRETLEQIPLVGKYFAKGDNSPKAQKEARHCLEALTDANIRSIYKQISWLHTSIDFEAINWLNQIVKTFWPCVKVTLNKIVFDDLLKPKQQRRPNVPKISKELCKKKTKLSVLISSRRKMLDLYKQRRRETQLSGQILDLINKSVFQLLIYMFKLAIIYTRQFTMDYVSALLKPKLEGANQPAEEEAARVNMFSSVLKDNDSTKLTERSSLSSGEMLVKKTSKDASNPNKSIFKPNINPVSRTLVVKKKGASGQRIICNPASKSPLNRHRQNRIKLAKMFINYANIQRDKSKARNKDLVIESINLGDSIPIVNGIKYVDDDRDFSEQLGEPVSSDASDMKFMIELSYNTDNKFNIEFNSLPILEHVSLAKVSFQLRLMVTVNHTTTELNKELDVLDTPGDILFPAINHLQVTLVDVPRLDWHLNRLEEDSNRTINLKDQKSRLLRLLKEFFDPIHLINNVYFKYLVHAFLYLTLKWFKPFDIKIGNHLYVKTIC